MINLAGLLGVSATRAGFAPAPAAGFGDCGPLRAILYGPAPQTLEGCRAGYPCEQELLTWVSPSPSSFGADRKDRGLKREWFEELREVRTRAEEKRPSSSRGADSASLKSNAARA